jgi:hypothetical protein
MTWYCIFGTVFSLICMAIGFLFGYQIGKIDRSTANKTGE